MKSKKSKRLVIDACVAQAVGANAKSKPSRDFLKSVLDICHQFVFTKDIKKEWEEHQGGYAIKWHSKMKSRKKRPPIKITQNKDLNTRILNTAKSDKQREAMEKDLLLIEAALEADKIIISLDDKAKKLFAKASQKVGEIKNVMWVNPSSDCNIIDWLKKGARPDKKRMLGYHEV